MRITLAILLVLGAVGLWMLPCVTKLCAVAETPTQIARGVYQPAAFCSQPTAHCQSYVEVLDDVNADPEHLLAKKVTSSYEIR